MTTRLEVYLRLPSDEHVWRYRHRTWAMWEIETGLKRETLKKHLEARGWSKNGGNGMSKAPCRLCPATFNPTTTQRKRTCPGCVTDRPETIVEREYQLYLKRCERPGYVVPLRVYTSTPHMQGNREVVEA